MARFAGRLAAFPWNPLTEGTTMPWRLNGGVSGPRRGTFEHDAECEAGTTRGSKMATRVTITVRYALGLLACLAGGSLAGAADVPQTSLVFPYAPHNRPNYRIPALMVVANGDLLAWAEKRNDGIGDVGNHDIVMKRSRDLGRTWSPEQIVLDDGDRCSTDITVGRDAESGRIWLFFLRDKKRYACMTSDDHGTTWQGPVSLHEQVTRPEWDRLTGKHDEEEGPPKSKLAIWSKGWMQRYGVGPGNAMVHLRQGKHAGRMVVPARHREDIGGGRLRSFSHVFYSDDRGQHWQPGGSVGANTSECQLVELAGGDLMVIARNESAEDAPDNLRHLVAVSRDGGASWGPVRRAEELITPRCHGCVERLSLAGPTDRNRLLFCSPAWPHREPKHPYGRYNLSVRLSYDEGQTWSTGRTIWRPPSAYSDLAVLPDGSIGLVYERGPEGSTHYWDEVVFTRFNADWVAAASDSAAMPAAPSRSHP